MVHQIIMPLVVHCSYFGQNLIPLTDSPGNAFFGEKDFLKNYLNISGIYGGPLTVKEIISHPHRKKTLERVRLHKLASSAYNVE